MPRDGSGVYSPPNGTVPVVSNTVIASAPYNSLVADIVQDLNTPRPVAMGGTGASNPADARSNLGAIGQSDFLGAFSIGDGFYTARDISSTSGTWLKRDGALYNTADYPTLSALLPALSDAVEWSSVSAGTTGNISAFLATSTGFYIGTKADPNSNIYFASTIDSGFALRATIPNFSIEGLVEGGGIIGAIDGNGKVSSSNNGITFSAPITVNANGFGPGAVAWSGTVFVAAGGNGTIYSSPDFSSWTLRTSSTTQFLYSVRYLNNSFVITGGGGIIRTAPATGDTWTARTSGSTANLYSSAFQGGTYVIVGDVSGGSAVILSSTNLGTWTPRTSGASVSLNAVTGSTSGFVAVGNLGTARLSSAGTSWAASPTGVSVNLTQVTFDPNNQATYYALGGGILLSGLRTLPTQFRVPNDGANEWIKALDEEV